MVRRFKITEKHKKILTFLEEFGLNSGEGNKINDLAKIMEVTPANIYDHIERLEKYGYLKKINEGTYGLNIILTSKGLRVLKDKNLKNDLGCVKRLDYDDIEIHKITFSKYVYVNEFSKTTGKKNNIWLKVAEKILKNEDINYTSSGISDMFFSIKRKSSLPYTVRVTPSLCTIIINEPISFRSLRSDQAKTWIMEIMEDISKEVEGFFNRGFRKLKISKRLSFLPKGRLGFYVGSQHIAHIDNKFAEYFHTNGYDLEILDEKDGKPRIIYDERSPSGPHLEFVHTKHAEDDSRRYSSFQKDIGKDNIDYVTSDLGGSEDVSEVISDVSRNEGLWEDIKSTPQKLNSINKMIQTTLIPAIKEGTEVDRRLYKNMNTHVSVLGNIDKGMVKVGESIMIVGKGIEIMNMSIEKMNKLLEKLDSKMTGKKQRKKKGGYTWDVKWFKSGTRK